MDIAPRACRVRRSSGTPVQSRRRRCPCRRAESMSSAHKFKRPCNQSAGPFFCRCNIDAPCGWAAHFSKAEEGVKAEVVLRGGRCDIVTEKYAIEVDRANKWHEAIGQAAHYALYLKKKPCIALYRADTLSKAQMEAMKRTTARRRIDVILLILPD